MKPDWKDAPAWARYLAMDADGAWSWFEYEPQWIPNMGHWSAAPRYEQAYHTLEQAANSLEERP